VLAAGLSVAVLSARSAQAQCGVDIFAPNACVGGGEGCLTNFFVGADFLVDTRAELIDAINSASPGDVIYILPNANIDLAPPGLGSTFWTIDIDVPDLTIASNRGAVTASGVAAGGRLRIDASDLSAVPPVSDPGHFPPLFRVRAPGVRFHGLWLDGSDYEVTRDATCANSEWPSYCPPTTDAIVVEPTGSIEIDNCELSGFSHSPVYLFGAYGDIHNNHIHHNIRKGLGYGVVLDYDYDTGIGAEATIESNIFDHNRHDIAASGVPKISYEARYNLVLGYGSSSDHRFDMHGENESTPPLSGWAGTNIVVEFNTFIDNGSKAVKVRGIPYGFGYLDNNWFTHAAITGSSGAFAQSMPASSSEWEPGETGTTPNDPRPPIPGGVTANNGFDRMRALNNCVNQTGWFRYDTKYQGFFPLARSGDGSASLAFVNFDGDSKADIFKTSGGKWYVSYDGVSSWTQVATEPYTLSELRFGDFVGDGKTDVFRASGSAWFAWNKDTGAWTPLASSSYGVSSLAFGNFVGDGKTDVFRASGSGWWVSSGGVGNWQQINSSQTTLASLAFGNFLGDSRTDVFVATGSEWKASDAGATNWQHLAWSSAGLADIVLGDFIGDSRTDVLISSPADPAPTWTTWMVSESGATTAVPYAQLNHGEYSAADLRAADFTGDGKSEVFFAGRP
jgi:hypothetical protein